MQPFLADAIFVVLLDEIVEDIVGAFVLSRTTHLAYKFNKGLKIWALNSDKMDDFNFFVEIRFNQSLSEKNYILRSFNFKNFILRSFNFKEFDFSFFIFDALYRHPVASNSIFDLQFEFFGIDFP